MKDRKSHHASAWSDYVRLCKAGGSKSFLELVKLANLRSPFRRRLRGKCGGRDQEIPGRGGRFEVLKQVMGAFFHV
jgi:hypothetical protein